MESQDPAESADWVAKVICDKPVRRAASIALTTDWWLAMASALIMALTLFWASNYLTSLAEASTAFIPLLYLLPLATGGAAAFMLATNRSPRLPKPISALIESAMAMTQKRLGTGTGGAA